MFETLMIRIAGTITKINRWVIAIFAISIINTIGLIVLLGNQQQTFDVTNQRAQAVKSKLEETRNTCIDVAVEVDKKLSN